MRKFLLYLLVLMCFSLSGWQLYRFKTKSADNLFFINQNDVLNNKQHKFISKNSGDLFDWESKKYTINLNNNKIYNAVEKFLDGENNEIKTINDKNLYFRNTVCGEYIKDHAFILYDPKVENNKSKNGYSLIIPLNVNDEIMLVKHSWSENKNNAITEKYKLNSFDFKSLMPEPLNLNNRVSLCFTGIIIPTKKYIASPIVGWFFPSDLGRNRDKDWTNLNGKDLKTWFNDIDIADHSHDENDKNISDAHHHTHNQISKYFVDTNLKDLTKFTRNYKHHIFYAIMWGLSGLFILYYLLRKGNR